MNPLNDRMEIFLRPAEIDQCIEFSDLSAATQQQIEYGETTTQKRSVKEIARDNLIGKLAEIAFQKFLFRYFKINVAVDFEIYPRGVWDSSDISINGHLFDIKSTRPGSSWLLIELNKLQFRKKEERLPDFFVAAVTGWDRGLDIPTGSVMLIGYARLREICHPDRIGLRTPDLCKGIPNTHFISRGSPLPGKNVIMQTDNCGRKFDHLHKSWRDLVNECMSPNLF